MPVRRMAGAWVSAAVLGTTLSLASATPANAAQGTFTYVLRNGTVHTLSDPKSGVCHNLLLDEAVAEENATDRYAVLYTERDCVAGGTLVAPGHEKELPFRSVLFSSAP
ncbi:hypothetical protein ACFV4F_22310 [Kitasatospora sp. NPDC059722]|uniref:hypothetical protein n=1 Tax=unclassified Kitasatospora TaxID=2633591 RepID=UPI003653D5D2